jgi:hypothetical protein
VNIPNVSTQFIEVSVLNFPAKQITHCIFSGSIPPSELWIIEKDYSIYFEASTPKGIKFRKRIK